jgi:hypothetical protein
MTDDEWVKKQNDKIKTLATKLLIVEDRIPYRKFYERLIKDILEEEREYDQV